MKESGMTDKVAEMQAHIREKRKPFKDWIMLIEEAGFGIRSAVLKKFNYRYMDSGAFFNHFLKLLPNVSAALIHQFLADVFHDHRQLQAMNEKVGELRSHEPCADNSHPSDGFGFDFCAHFKLLGVTIDQVK